MTPGVRPGHRDCGHSRSAYSAAMTAPNRSSQPATVAPDRAVASGGSWLPSKSAQPWLTRMRRAASV
jgi:hypothetical protein